MQNPRAFTLVEMIVVLIVSAVLTLLLISAVQKSRSAARRVDCTNNLKQIGQGLILHSVSHNSYPPRKPSIANSMGSTCTYERIGWQIYILPYIEQAALWNNVLAAYDKNSNPYPDTDNPSSEMHVKNSQVVVKMYSCPGDPRTLNLHSDINRVNAAFTSYAGVTGYSSDYTSGMFGREVGVRDFQIRDGLSNTVMIGERPPPDSVSMGWWYTAHGCTGPSPSNDFEVPVDSGLSVTDSRCGGKFISWPITGNTNMNFFSPGLASEECDKYHFWSMHLGGANFVFVDGSVRFLGYSSKFILRNLATIAGGEIVDTSSY